MDEDEAAKESPANEESNKCQENFRRKNQKNKSKYTFLKLTNKYTDDASEGHLIKTSVSDEDRNSRRDNDQE